MSRLLRVSAAALAVMVLWSAAPRTAPSYPSIASYLKPGLPIELVSARKVDTIAWIAYEAGKRNVFAATGPLFTPVRVTAFLNDDGVDLTELKISDDGSTVTFVRGSATNRAGWVANPSSDPNGPERAIWGAKIATPGVAWKLAVIEQGTNTNTAQLAPNGSAIVYMKDGQIYRARINGLPQTTKMDKGEEPYIEAWGLNSGPKWSPDSTKIAFSSNRTDHSFIGVYDVTKRAITWMAPSVDRDTAPAWSPDGTKLVFLRRPGLPFGAQATPGAGSGMPDNGAGAAGGRGGNGRGAAAAPGAFPGAVPGAAPAAAPTGAPAGAPPAAAPAQANGARQGGGGRGGRAGGGAGQNANQAAAGQGAQANTPPALIDQPGLYRATLPGGLAMVMMVADPATGEAKELWHPAADDRLAGNLNNYTFLGDTVVFTQQGGGRGGGAFGGGGTGNGGGLLTPLPMEKRNGPGDEESPKYYALSLAAGSSAVLLNPTVGVVDNDEPAWTLSRDGKTFYYSTNATMADPLDLDRRHILSMPLTGGAPKAITGGDGIEVSPVPLANGKQIAVMSSDPKRPMSIGIWPVDGSGAAGQKAQKVIYPTLGPDFPINQEVVPQMIALKAEDGVEFHNQLFLPKDIKPGEKRPALIFVHGGPQRQMLLGWHYLSFYHVFYGVNQWLAAQGYVVLSVNYRSGTGYGQSFRGAAEVGGRGNSEYRDVLAAGKWLAARADVDPNRVGIWGLSYGGLLTAEALARNSDIFKAGVDLAGVHLEGNSLDPESVSYKSSSISAIDNWKSPVLLFQGDDDRNVNFAQMVGLVQLLRARNIYHELVVFPDDVHETLLHKRWLYTFDRMETFLKKFLSGDATSTTSK